uniref:Uncharacterized protein n=1 Tax=Romanomermis culicivorax TaxID=13658 RepID=A0A915L8R3_ROMCU
MIITINYTNGEGMQISLKVDANWVNANFHGQYFWSLCLFLLWNWNSCSERNAVWGRVPHALMKFDNIFVCTCTNVLISFAVEDFQLLPLGGYLANFTIQPCGCLARAKRQRNYYLTAHRLYSFTVDVHAYSGSINLDWKKMMICDIISVIHIDSIAKKSNLIDKSLLITDDNEDLLSEVKDFAKAIGFDPKKIIGAKRSGPEVTCNNVTLSRIVKVK